MDCWKRVYHFWISAEIRIDGRYEIEFAYAQLNRQYRHSLDRLFGLPRSAHTSRFRPCKFLPTALWSVSRYLRLSTPRSACRAPSLPFSLKPITSASPPSFHRRLSDGSALRIAAFFLASCSFHVRSPNTACLLFMFF